MTAQTQQAVARRPQVVIVGGGFGGIQVARQLGNAPVDVLVLNNTNYLAFWPLLYQVATAGLEAQQIAYPIRGLLRRFPNVHFHVATAERVDVERQELHTTIGVLPYDELVLAAGTSNNFFGLEGVREHGFGFKELPEALALRNHIIMCFERAATETDPEQLRRLLTFVVVGGGPTGVELAGATAELIRHVMRKDYPGIDFSQVRVLLVEAMDRVLLTFPASLSRKAQRKLRKLGVELRLQATVADYDGDVLRFKDSPEIPTATVAWAAGIQGAPIGTTLDVPLERGRRVRVTSMLHLPEHPNIWVLGDMAYVEAPDGKPYGQLATVALQQGAVVADNILRKQQGRAMRPFRYFEKGTMATVGRHFAVARIWGLNWSGTVAWLLWLAVHLLYLVGVRNRLVVLVTWFYNYVTYDRSARAMITVTSDR